MDNVIRLPLVGSNQHLTKFGTKAKRKFKVKTATKIKVLVLVSLLLSLWLNYMIIRTNYVFRCEATFDGVKQNWDLGYFESKDTCDNLVQDHLRNLTQ